MPNDVIAILIAVVIIIVHIPIIEIIKKACPVPFGVRDYRQ